MAKVIAIVSQKGGVGKTTTAANVAAALAEEGQRVLLIEVDPQGGLAESLGVRIDGEVYGFGDLLRGWASDEDALQATSVKNLTLIPCGRTEGQSELDLETWTRENPYCIREMVDGMRERFDSILLDSPASLGHITRGILCAADSYLVPLQAEELSYRTIPRVLQVAEEIQQAYNPDLSCEGFLLTMVDLRPRLARKVVNQLYENYGDRIMVSMVPRTIRLQEMTERGKPSVAQAPKSRGAEAYREVAREILMHQEMPDQETVEAEIAAVADALAAETSDRRQPELRPAIPRSPYPSPSFEGAQETAGTATTAGTTAMPVWSDTVDQGYPREGWLADDDELTVN